MDKIDYRQSALKEAQRVSEFFEVVACPITKTELYFKVSSERVFAFESFGDCADCGQSFHVSVLHNSATMSPSEWPVHYLGKYCKDCFYKEEVELTEEEIAALQVSDEADDGEE